MDRRDFIKKATIVAAGAAVVSPKPTKDIYFAGGCFWGTEHFFKQIEGVAVTEVGFANGHTENPTYKEVYTDQTGFAETVFVRFYPEVVSLEFLLQMFFKAIDPTSLNKQGHDEGTRYRTGVYYTDPADLPVIDKVFAEEQKNYEQPLAVEKLPLQNFYTAEEYHQDYLDKNPDGYCHLPLSLFEFARKAKPARPGKEPPGIGHRGMGGQRHQLRLSQGHQRPCGADGKGCRRCSDVTVKTRKCS